METRPPPKSFWMVPFTIHATRGLLRDERSRRRTIAISLLAAIVMLIAGLTVLKSWLDPHQHPWRFILFWFACAWDTVLVLLLALLDMLMVRAQARRAREILRAEFSETATPDVSDARDEE